LKGASRRTWVGMGVKGAHHADRVVQHRLAKHVDVEVNVGVEALEHRQHRDLHAWVVGLTVEKTNKNKKVVRRWTGGWTGVVKGRG
jgi:hypothetical protein